MKYFLLLFLLVGSSIYGQDLKISQGEFLDKVNLSWPSVPKADYYSIERIYDATKISRKGKAKDVTGEILAPITKTTSFTDDTIPFGQHKYIINAYQTNIEAKKETKKEQKARERLIKKHGTNINIPIITNISVIASFTNTGYRKISDKEFFLEFQKSIDSSLPRIRTMKMLNFFGEKQNGWKHGQLIYKTTGIIKKPFRVMIEYKDFIDQNLKINGLYEVQIFKLFAQEGKLVGTLHVDGIYKGVVTHNLIIDGGRAVDGTYEVQQEGRALVSLPWDVAEHPLDDSQYEDTLKSTLKESKKTSS